MNHELNPISDMMNQIKDAKLESDIGTVSTKVDEVKATLGEVVDTLDTVKKAQDDITALLDELEQSIRELSDMASTVNLEDKDASN